MYPLHLTTRKSNKNQSPQKRNSWAWYNVTEKKALVKNWVVLFVCFYEVEEKIMDLIQCIRKKGTCRELSCFVWLVGFMKTMKFSSVFLSVMAMMSLRTVCMWPCCTGPCLLSGCLGTLATVFWCVTFTLWDSLHPCPTMCQPQQVEWEPHRHTLPWIC